MTKTFAANNQTGVPQEFMFGIDATPLDPELLDFTGKTSSGKSGGRGLIYSQERGRYIKPMLPRGKVSHFDWLLIVSDSYSTCSNVLYGVTQCILVIFVHA
jgi:hypothetical protein